LTDGIWLLIIIGVIALILVVATIKGWVSWRGGRGIATITAFHDFQPKDKQEAIEIVIEKKAGKKWAEQESGKDKEGEAQKGSPQGSKRPI